MRIRDAFARIKRDPAWKRKVGTGLLITLIPYLGAFVVSGWALDYQRAVAWDTDEGLPEWGDWFDRGKDGFLAILPGYVYTLVSSLALTIPGIAVGAVSLAVLIAGSGSGEPTPSALALSVAVLLGGTVLFSAAWSVVMVPFIQVPAARYALYRDLSMAFRWTTTWRQVKAGGATFRQAWRFSALYVVCVGFIAQLWAFANIAGPLFALSSGETTAGLVYLATWAAYPLIYLAASLIAVPALLLQAVLWGLWAREAYALGDATGTTGTEPAATAGSTDDPS